MRTGNRWSSPSGAAVLLGGLVGLAGATLSCRPSRPCTAVPSTTVASAPRRDHCLAPPWVVDPSRPAAGVDGWSAAICTEGPGQAGRRHAEMHGVLSTQAYFVHDGTRAISDAELEAVLEEVRGAGDMSGLGGCCSAAVAAATKMTCLKFWSNVCRLEMSRVVQAVDEALRRRGLANVRIGVDVDVSGRVGPRCAPADPACGPLSSRDPDETPADQRDQAGCVAGRVRVAEPRAVTPGLACAHDGECMVASCETDCLRWDQSPGAMSCPDVGRLEEPLVVYCGCVAGRCDWFRPGAP